MLFRSDTPEASLDTISPPRLWSLHARNYPYNTNNVEQFPVKDRMGPSWWSGRFSAKFDAWRISVMKADSDPDYKPEGLLEMCSATQEDLAKCYILLQLRDMCKTKLAADSLWVSFYHWQ